MSLTARHGRAERVARPAGALLVRPRPIPREAAAGYVVRVAQANGYATPSQLWHALQSTQAPATFEDLIKRVGVSSRAAASLLGPLPHYWRSPANCTQGLTASDYNHSLIRWCPRCLEIAPHLRGVWGLKLQCVCPKHRTRLVDRCPACGATQRFERGDITQCPCGGRLAAAERLAASPLQCQICNSLAHGSVGHASSTLPELSVAEWHRLVRYLGQFTTQSQPQRPGQIAGLHRLEVAAAVISNTARLLDSWPQHFTALLAAIQTCEPRTQSLARSFGRLYRVLYMDLQAPCFEFLRRAFEDYLHENWWGYIGRRNRSLRTDTVSRHPRMSVDEAARLAGTAPSVARHLVQAQLIPSVASETPSGRCNRTVHKGDIERLVELTQDTMTMTEAATSLALPKRRVRALVDSGVIAPVVSRRSLRAAAWRFPRAELARLAAVTGESCNASHSVAFKRILQCWRLRDGEFVALVKAIESGDLRSVSAVPRPLGEAALDAEAVRAYLQSTRASVDDWLSVDQAAHLLGVKQQVAYELIAVGLLKGTSTRSGHRRVSRASLREFLNTYVSLADLARKQTHSPKWTLQSLGAHPVTGPSVDGSRQYFFRRADICEEELPSVCRVAAEPTNR